MAFKPPVNFTAILTATISGLLTAGTLLVLGAAQFSDGTVSSPGFQFASDTNTGLRRISADNMGVVAGGADILRVAATSVTALQSVYSPALNSSTQPNFSLSSPTTGFYSPTLNTVALTLNGSVSFWARDDYNVMYDGIIPVTNNALDSGIYGNAWRYVTASSSVRTKDLSVSDTATATTLIVTGSTKLATLQAGPIYNNEGNALDITAIGGQMLTLNGEGGTWLGGNYNGSNVGVIFYDDQYPQTDDTYDSGTTTARWKSVNTVKLSATSTMATHSTTTNSIYAAGLSALGATGDFVCQNNTTGELQVQLTNCTISSARFKEHIKTLDTEELAKRVGALRSVMFDYRNGDVGSIGTVQDEGFIAEEVAMIDPYLVGWVEGTNEQIKEVESLYPDLKLINRDGKIFIPQTVDYMKISVLLVGSDQYQNEQIMELQKQMEGLKNEDVSIWDSIKQIINSL